MPRQGMYVILNNFIGHSHQHSYMSSRMVYHLIRNFLCIKFCTYYGVCVYVSQNLLFSDIGENAVLKVVDFGFARLLSDESKMLTTPCYTLTYAAPEVLSTRHNGGYTEACDLWSIGVILVSLTGTRGRGREGREKEVI